MANIAAVLKEEISRLSRKETRGETASLKKASAQYRAEIAALKPAGKRKAKCVLPPRASGRCGSGWD